MTDSSPDDNCGAPAPLPADAAADRLQITPMELLRVQVPPKPAARVPAALAPGLQPGAARAQKRSRLPLISLITALVGIVAFGLVTGIVAVVMASIALAGRQTTARDVKLAVSGLVLGLIDAVGWLALMVALSGADVASPMIDVALEPDFLDNVTPEIRQALAANVLIECTGGWSKQSVQSVGSGIIMDIHDGRAVVLTNRHVIDSSRGNWANEPPPKVDNCRIKLLGQPFQPAEFVWVAPHGIDLALVSVAVSSDIAEAAHLDPDATVAVGESVFAVGNPMRLAWSHTSGTVSQLRHQKEGLASVDVIQTNASINPGNSGGGLYNAKGALVGVNTWTHDKRFGEGLGFAISVRTLLKLKPPLHKGAPVF